MFVPLKGVLSKEETCSNVVFHLGSAMSSIRVLVNYRLKAITNADITKQQTLIQNISQNIVNEGHHSSIK